MTHDEADVVLAATTVAVGWVPHPEGFVGMVALDGSTACPLLTTGGKCSIHASRPYNCRRFLCLRDEGEALVTGGPFGCANTEPHLASRPHRRLYERNQRTAQVWARAHGWVG